MQTIDISNPAIITVHCPFCGTQTISHEGEPVACPHLVYVSSSETPDDPWFEKNNLAAYEPEEGESVIDGLEKGYPSSDYILFLLSEPPPAGLELYVLYTHSPQLDD